MFLNFNCIMPITKHSSWSKRFISSKHMHWINAYAFLHGFLKSKQLLKIRKKC